MKEYLILYRNVGRITPFGSRPSVDMDNVTACLVSSDIDDTQAIRQGFVVSASILTMQVVVDSIMKLHPN